MKSSKYAAKLHFSGGSHAPTECTVCGHPLSTSGSGAFWTFNPKTFATRSGHDLIPCGKISGAQE